MEIKMLIFKLLLSGSLIFSTVTASFHDYLNNEQSYEEFYQVEKEDFLDKDELEPEKKCNKPFIQEMVNHDLEPDYRLVKDLKHVVPLHYDLHLTISKQKDFMNGTSRIRLEILKPTQNIAFHYLKPLDIEMRLFDENGEVCINRYTYHALLHVVKMYFDPMLQSGFYTLEFKFTNFLPETKSVEVTYTNQFESIETIATTHLQPFNAHTLFPCFDEPEFKSTFNITVWHHFTTAVVSNMPFENVTWMKDFMKESKFQQTAPIPIYRVVLVMTPSYYTTIFDQKGNKIFSKYNVMQELEYANEMIEKISAQYDWERSINIEYRTHVILPYTEKTYRHFGVCTYTEAEVFYREHLDPFMQKIEIVRAIGHALADQWFTNVMPPSWWSSLWVNKGISEFLSLDILNKTFPEWRIMDLFVVQTQHESLHLDTENIMKPLTSDTISQSEIKSLFSFPFYMKAPIIIRMMRHILSGRTFFMYINALVDYAKPETISTTNFLTFLEDILNKLNLSINLPHGKEHNFKQIMEPWIKLKHYPLVNVERNYETGEITLSQQHFQEEDINSEGTWWIPIVIVRETNANFVNTKPLMWLNPSNKQTTVNNIEKGWIMLNPQQSGYYRVNYDTQNWMLIANYLNSKNYTRIHVLNRAKIIDDAYHLLVTNQLDYNIFFKLTEYMIQETDYIAWYPMFKIFEYFSGFLPYEESAFLKSHLVKLLNGLLENIGYEEKDMEDDFTKILRLEAAKWACTLGSPICMAQAKYKLHEYFTLLSRRVSLPTSGNGWKDWIFRKGMVTIDMDYWNKMIDHINVQRNFEKGFEILSFSENPVIINNTLNLMFAKNGMKGEQEKLLKKGIYEKPLKVISSIFANHARLMLQDMLPYLKGHSEHLVIKILVITINHLYNVNHLDMVNKFAQSNLKNTEAIANIQYLIKIRLSQMRDHMAKFRKWFKLKEIKIKKDTAMINESEKIFKSTSTVTVPRKFLLDNILPLHYDIKLIIPKHIKETNFTFDGESNIKIIIYHATQEICLHSEQKIHKASLTRVKYVAPNSLNYTKVYDCTKFAYNSIEQILVLHFEVMLSPGYYILNMKFESSLDNFRNSFSKSLYKNGSGSTYIRVWLFTAHSQPIRARQLFPCWDEPTLKTTFNISINHDPMYRPMSNMPVKRVHIENETIWTHFDITPTMTTYHMAMAIMIKDLYRISNIRKSVNIWCRMLAVPYMSLGYTVVETVMQDFLQYTDSLKISKIDHLVIPEMQEESIGNWGLNVYREAAIIYDAESDPVAHKINAARLVARSVIHQLLNNVSNPSWWFYPWLNEGFSEFLGTYAIDKNLICPRAMDLFVVQLQHESLHLDTDYNMQSLTLGNSSLDIQSLFSFPFYVKAPVIIRMLQYIITNTLFVQGEIYANFEIKQLTPYDIYNTMEFALRKLNTKQSDYTLREIMNTWIMQSNYPTLNVIRDYSNGHVTISQEENFSLDQNWWIPITYATRTNPYFSNIFSIHWIKPDSRNITLYEIDKNTGWIIVNLQQIGYYRVNYDRTNWILISNYLKSKEYKNIHVLNRAQIIDDAYHLLMANKLDYKIFLDLTEYLSEETDYIAWYPMFKILEYFSSFLPYKESESLKSHMVKIFRGLLAKIGYEEYPKGTDFIKCLRQEAVKWSCILGDMHCKIIAKQKLEEYLVDPMRNKLLPGWKHWTYCAGLTTANGRSWYKVWDTFYEKKSINKALELLSCSESSTIINDALEVMLSKNITIEDNKRTEIIYSLIAKHARNNLEGTLMQLTKYNIHDVTKALIIAINNVYSDDQLVKINEFMQSYGMNRESIKNIQTVIRKRSVVIKYHRSKFSKILTK